MMRNFIIVTFYSLLLTILTGCSVIFPAPEPKTTPTPIVYPTVPTGEIIKQFRTEKLLLNFYYNNNKYQYYGTITLPNPCYQVKVDALISESYPEQVSMNIITQDSGEICVQVISEQIIAGELAVSRDAVIRVKLNGTEIPENLD